MININIIGRGNVAFHLMKAFQGKADVIPVNPRSLEGFDLSAPVSLICVSDQAIPEVASAVQCLGYPGLVAHTSGSTDIEVVSRLFPAAGVFYPLQTFSRSKPLNYARIPFFIEGSSAEAEQSLRELALLISPIVSLADSSRRRILHIASVFSCNFVNHLWNISAGLLRENGMDFSLLLPLLEETLEKVHSLDPAEAQTGPAIRRDHNIMESHLQALSPSPRVAEIYRLLSSSIISSDQKPND